MLPQKFDTTLALKAIALSDLLTKTEKRVGAAVLDHFNRSTSRCDPSQEMIAALLGINRRTVNRAIKKLVKIGYFKSFRHRGTRHCNSYLPSWPRFRAEEDCWKAQAQAC
jgi:DNA-binding MarR family transcriptional regulator